MNRAPYLPEHINDTEGHKPTNVRTPRRLWRVRWNRPHWLPDSTGSTRWNYRYKGTEAAAIRVAERRESEGCRVEIGVFDLHTQQVRRYESTGQ